MFNLYAKLANGNSIHLDIPSYRMEYTLDLVKLLISSTDSGLAYLDINCKRFEHIPSARELKDIDKPSYKGDCYG